jgi:hypothetical protein
METDIRIADKPIKLQISASAQQALAARATPLYSYDPGLW